MEENKNLKIAPGLHKRVKLAALEDDIKLQEWVECALEIALEQRGKVRTKAKQRQNGTSSD